MLASSERILKIADHLHMERFTFGHYLITVSAIHLAYATITALIPPLLPWSYLLSVSLLCDP